MACSKCGKKRSITHRQTLPRASSVSSIQFIEAYYIGVPGAAIPTTFRSLSYGSRQYGEKMIVAKVDFDKYEGIWQLEDPNSIN